MELGFNYNDGGRAKYFNVKGVSDCVCRAIAIGNDMDYKEVYDLINEYAKKEHTGKRKKRISSQNFLAKKEHNCMPWKTNTVIKWTQ